MFVHLVRAQVCPKDYLPALLKWIDEENLPTYLGGKSKATLLDDSGPWNDPALVAQIEAELKAVRCTPRCVWDPCNEHHTSPPAFTQRFLSDVKTMLILHRMCIATPGASIAQLQVPQGAATGSQADATVL